MLTPSAFNASEREAPEPADSSPFALLVSVVDGAPVMTHIPILRDGRKLLGHLARINPHVKFLDGPATVVFHGPHGYVSPHWYVSGSRVPTWNYTAVHVSGSCRTIDDARPCRALIDNLVNRFEAGLWKVDWNDPYYLRLLDAITFFEIAIADISATFKLSQNRGAADVEAVIESLKTSDRNADADVAAMMERHTRGGAG